MKKTAPHYLLFTQANSYSSGGRWKFVLEQIGSDDRIVESDDERHVRGERLHLLAVVRGLESLDQPSHVTLITPSRRVGQGIRNGLATWSQQGWQIEEEGKLKPLRHADLWQRIHVAMKFHKLHCRVWHFDAPKKPPRKETQHAEPSNPFVTPFAGTMVRSDRPEQRPNRIKIDEQVRKTAFRNSATMVSGSKVLGDHVKPLGHGRAYGYAVN